MNTYDKTSTRKYAHVREAYVRLTKQCTKGSLNITVHPLLYLINHGDYIFPCPLTQCCRKEERQILKVKR
ncbi:hypothetical protein POVWA2_059870 [Plasmodium ovale wallikeri]|uniref:Uncharacterized protein n=1 Tax=Plasmodium ovale wallikeri TaxID=864142 RepID=A0A1A9A2E0_PLAOA|nr:hypothetical protein POVWA1_060490 [Plasmodium ovale wallikeri]SBT50333.1 hypothetical protein POVWA2_059870 [Plasmodium ovale wallikeri]